MQFCISFLINYYEPTMPHCIESSMDPDQLAPLGPADQDLTCFLIEFIPGLTPLIESLHRISKARAS